MKREYTTSDFDFVLPETRIAQVPARPRDHARLLVYDRRAKSIVDDYFYNIDSFLPADSTLVLNNSKVEKCRLVFGATEIFVLETVSPSTIRALVRPGKKFKEGSTLQFDGHTFKTIAVDALGIRTLHIDVPITDARFDVYRQTPLPPYIEQNESLADEYQTVYADPLGSKAAPTAGLHFTEALLERLHAKHEFAEVTLHVGLGTFAPVKTDSLTSHVMHKESYEISPSAARLINQAKHRTAIGTTSVRVLESAQRNNKGKLQPGSSQTDIFITPGFEFTYTDALVTNFHLPKTTLLMLVAAFMGDINQLHRVYAHAIDRQYRFYSFGDAMLIL